MIDADPRLELVALVLHQLSVDATLVALGRPRGSIVVRRDLAIDEYLVEAARMLRALDAGWQECRGCGSNRAKFCEHCARLGITCGDVPDMRYCEGCASILTEVMEVGPRGEDGFGFEEFARWDRVASESESLDILRDVAGFRSGWRLQDGSIWPCLDVTDEDGGRCGE